MTTTQQNYEFAAAEDQVEVYDALSSVDQGVWSARTFWDRVKIDLVRVGSWFCCFGDEVERMEADNYLRNRIRAQMQVASEAVGSTAPETVTRHIYRDTGYDMSNFRNAHKQARADAIAAAKKRVALAVAAEESCMPVAQEAFVVPEYHDGVVELVLSGGMPPVNEAMLAEQYLKEEWEKAVAEQGLVDGFETLPEHRRIAVVPRFVAVMCTALRAKFGRLGLNEANRLLIEREYLRMCREGSVRNCDIVHHSQWVYNAYFGEGVLDELPTTRVRLPAWVRRIIGRSPVVPPTVC